MTLGGLALAVGILVDDATVEIENINRNLAMGKETVQAILDGAQQIATPAFVSTLCICIVFIPMFFLSGVAKFLFVPLAEAVTFAMLASYMWSRTIVPTMAMYLLSADDEYDPEKHRGEKQSFFRKLQQTFEHGFEKFRAGYHDALNAALSRSLLFAACFLTFCVLSAGLIFFLGRDFFPKVDAGQIRLHFRARTGLRIEETARLADQVDGVIRETIPKEELQQRRDLWHLRRGNPSAAQRKTRQAHLRVHCGPARKAAAALPGRAVFLPARGHRHTDFELWRARAHRRAGHRHQPAGQLPGGGKTGQ
jgi:multidrug efflux pump subunit AcrB